MIPETYFQQHSLDSNFLKKSFGVVWDKDKITIPVYGLDEKLLYCKYRHLDFEEKKASGDKTARKFSFDLGGHPTLFAIHKIKDQKEVVLCEGEPDAMRLWQEKIPAITSTGGVTTFTPIMATPLKGKTVYIVLDTDQAGTSEIEKYYNTLLEAGALPKIISLPKEYKDVSLFFTAGKTKEDFNTLLKEAISLDEWLNLHEDPNFALTPGTSLLTEDLPEEEWLLDRLIPAEGFTFLVGAEATGKSFYTLSIAHALTTGTPWLGKFEVKKKVKVLFIDKENTKRRTQSRMKGLEMSGQDIFWLSFPHFFELSDEKSEDGLSPFAKSLARKVKNENIGLIIIDSFTDVMVGNENASGDVQGFFDAMRQLFPSTSILVIHHVNKPAAGVPRTASQRARGSTNIMAQIYSGLYVESIPKVKNEFTMEQTKAGDSEKIQKFKIIMKVGDIYESPGKTKVTALEYGGEFIDAEGKMLDAMEIIIEILNDTPIISRMKLMEMTLSEGHSEATTRRAIKQLLDDGTIDEAQDGRQKSYSLIGREKSDNLL